jgi:rhodanese-related sulfurtransferase
LRPVAVIVAVGIALGLGFNALGRAGKPPRGLAWISEATKIESLEEAQAGAKPPAPSPAAQPVAATQVSDDPLAIATGSTGAGEGLPEIPDVGRPIEIQLSAAKKFFDAGAALFVDAREASDYAAGHVPGAVNLPFDESITDPGRLEKLDGRGKPIIVYCGGGGCEVSIQMAGALIQVGHKKVLVFEGGYPDWETAKYPVASGAEPGGAQR